MGWQMPQLRWHHSSTVLLNSKPEIIPPHGIKLPFKDLTDSRTRNNLGPCGKQHLKYDSSTIDTTGICQCHTMTIE
uniref:AC4 n=1 Tax=Heterorhabditis bacteriophora TaxID=37862 RepID=A0A1I7WWP0_HETBA